MSQYESELKGRESLPEQPLPTPQPPNTTNAQNPGTPLRRPQNFDDWETRRRDDDPTR
jgi:hypothetical protein